MVKRRALTTLIPCHGLPQPHRAAVDCFISLWSTTYCLRVRRDTTILMLWGRNIWIWIT